MIIMGYLFKTYFKIYLRFIKYRTIVLSGTSKGNKEQLVRMLLSIWFYDALKLKSRDHIK